MPTPCVPTPRSAIAVVIKRRLYATLVYSSPSHERCVCSIAKSKDIAPHNNGPVRRASSSFRKRSGVEKGGYPRAHSRLAASDSGPLLPFLSRCACSGNRLNSLTIFNFSYMRSEVIEGTICEHRILRFLVCRTCLHGTPTAFEIRKVSITPDEALLQYTSGGSLWWGASKRGKGLQRTEVGGATPTMCVASKEK